MSPGGEEGGAHPHAIEGPKVVTIEDADGLRRGKEIQASRLPYQHRNPAV